LARASSRLRQLKNFTGLAAITLLSILAILPLFHIIGTVAINGLKAITRSGLDFLTKPPNPLNPSQPGGIAPVLKDSLLLVILSSIIGIPLALLTGVFISEFRSATISRLVFTLSLLLVEFPTILVGLYVYSVIVKPMGHYSLLAGAISLSLVMMPYVAVQVSEALRNTPRDVREAAFSLGVSRTRVVYNILLGAARKSIIVGVLIGVAKIAGETAPLLFTAGGSFTSQTTCALKPGGAIPLMIYEYIQQPGEGYRILAWGASLILLLVVFTIMIIAKILVKEVKL